MEKNKSLRKNYPLKTEMVFFLAAFFLWWFAFRRFFLGELSFVNDATPYYGHFKFYIDNLLKGIIPLWDTVRNGGVPNELFLRRIGAFNPFIGIIIILVKCGVPFTQAYLSFLAFYYFLGAMGFYFLCRLLLKDFLYSYCGFLLLLFSSLTGLLFNSFVVLVFTPMIWFFYHSVSFYQNPSKGHALGITFCLMLLVSTYIPFYFLTIFIIFAFCFILFYFKLIPNVVKVFYSFCKENKGFVILCILFVLLASLPGALFYIDGGKGEYVLPSRHGTAEVDHALVVARQNTAKGGIVAFSFMDELFGRPKDMVLGLFYYPIFIHILFLFSIFIAINRRLAFFALFILFAYIVGVYDATPIYRFLYQYVFFFKFFRNFQFFLWLVILPLYVLICVHHLKFFLEEKNFSTEEAYKKIGMLTVIHVGCIIFFALQKQVIVASFLSLALSYVFFCGLIFKKAEMLPHFIKKDKSSLILGIVLLCAIVSHPLQVYHYLGQNARKAPKYYQYELPYLFLFYPHEIGSQETGFYPREPEYYAKEAREKIKDIKNYTASNEPGYYISATWYSKLYRNLNLDILDFHMNGARLRVYDTVEWIDDNDLSMEYLGEIFAKNANKVILNPDHRKGSESFVLESTNRDTARSITPQSKDVQLISLEPNHLILETNFEKNAFLVYNDAYTSKWRSFIDEREVPLWKANLAFKGVYVPAGKHRVSFRYEKTWKYVYNYFLIVLFFFVFLYYIRQYGKLLWK